MRTAHRGHLCPFSRALCTAESAFATQNHYPNSSTNYTAFGTTAGGTQITTALHSTANSSRLRACSHWSGSCRDRTLRHYNTTVLTAARPIRAARTDPVLWVNEHLSCKDKYTSSTHLVLDVAKEQGCGGSLDSLEAMARALTPCRAHDSMMMMPQTMYSQWVSGSRP
jgi:hypothetical protein